MDRYGDDQSDDRDETISFDPVEEARALRGREAAAGIPELSGFALVVASGPGRGRHWLLAEGEHEAGRNPDALVFLDDITVSRHHAAFTVEANRLRVRDLGSTNGTYVNGARADSAELASGDEVIVGRFHLVVTHGV
jgi:pSer/pThr/pTyr-binding forkhead associated (FHA) protein